MPEADEPIMGDSSADPPRDDGEGLPTGSLRDDSTVVVGCCSSSSPELPSPAVPPVPGALLSHDECLVQTLCRIDPLLVFLTKSTGQVCVPLPLLRRALPPGGIREAQDEILARIGDLIRMGILHLHSSSCPEPSSALDAAAPRPREDASTVPSPADSLSSLRLRWDDAECKIGFPPQGVLPPQRSLHGSTKTGAKRRLAALRRAIREGGGGGGRRTEKGGTAVVSKDDDEPLCADVDDRKAPPFSSFAAEEEVPSVTHGSCESDARMTSDPPLEFAEDSDELRAVRALSNLLGFDTSTHAEGRAATLPGDGNEPNGDLPDRILPRQASYAGSFPAHPSVHGSLPRPILDLIPKGLLRAYGIQPSTAASPSSPVILLPAPPPRNLYRHQVEAITAALQEGRHVSVCTGTGSGKSLCFWIPVLSAAYHSDQVSFVLFPTKALAQDQLAQLRAVLDRGGGGEEGSADLLRRIRPAALDGDTLFSDRARIADSCNVILTNPDTLHASLLPQWKTSSYRTLWRRLRYVVLDECHVYEGAFGAHVSMVLSRLVRVRAAAILQGPPGKVDGGATERSASEPPSSGLTFLAASATVPWPEVHFRALCPVAENEPVVVLAPQDDGSPRAEKHFIVWNPPLLHSDGSSTHRVAQRPKTRAVASTPPSSSPGTATTPGAELEGKKSPPTHARPLKRRRHTHDNSSFNKARFASVSAFGEGESGPQLLETPVSDVMCHRRHAADETALLFARAVSNGTRCIAFCKTRNLVEWVFERAQAALLRTHPHLASQIESYRGGYSMEERRKIEQRLFRSELLGVVGTNALELGVDIGGIDLTLHCGYPSSYASLLQQAGRGGRGKERLDVPSCAVVVCFGSPLEQHLWKNPKSVLEKGAIAKHTIPLTSGLIQGHMLCASEEFPLTGRHPISAVYLEDHVQARSDHDLFGGEGLYEEALVDLTSTCQALISEKIGLPSTSETLTVYRARASLCKAHSRVSIRSIEPVNYALIDLTHPGQGGKQDGIHDSKAILDTIPYSRIFYHAHPGAVITHRGRKLKVLSMTRPPPFTSDQFGCRRGLHLASYATPTNVKYATRPLSKLQITVVKAIERVELGKTNASSVDPETDQSSVPNPVASPPWAFAGCGAVSVKRTVHGYKKISLINGTELERSELSLPPMEYETFGLWFDVEADVMAQALGERYGPGVHALSHALLAVAPIFAPGLARSDLECDHSFYEPTRIMLFDERAGGSGACERLWNVFFRPNSIMEAAIDLLEECSSCNNHVGYDSGCPACLHASNCMKFNMHLSRSAGAEIGRHVLSRLQESQPFLDFVASAKDDTGRTKQLTPRREARRKAVKKAKELLPASERQFVVGRVSWPLDSS